MLVAGNARWQQHSCVSQGLWGGITVSAKPPLTELVDIKIVTYMNTKSLKHWAFVFPS